MGKNLLNSNISSTCPYNMVKFGPLAAETTGRFWVPQQISRGFVSWLHYCSDVAEQKSPKLCTMFGHLLGWYTIFTFLGALARNPARCKIHFASKSCVLLDWQHY